MACLDADGTTKGTGAGVPLCSSRAWVRPSSGDAILSALTQAGAGWGLADTRYRTWSGIPDTALVMRCDTAVPVGPFGAVDPCGDASKPFVPKPQIQVTTLPPPVVGGGTGALTWTQSTQSALAGFKVYHGQGQTAAQPLTELLATISNPAIRTYTAAGLAVGTHLFEITAFNTAGLESARSNRVSVVVAAVPPPVAGAFTPINLNDPADAPLVKFGETALRNWNFEGHVMTAAFNASYGNWALNDTTFEPWLFDRASVAYIMWKRSGDPRWRTEFDTLFAFYRTHIDAGGIFTPKGQDDTKYSYVRPFYYYEQATGDTQYRPIAKRIHDRWVAELPNTYSTGIGLWTEREVGLALDAAIYYYRISNDPAALTRARAMVAQWGAVSASTGAPLHALSQHGEEFDNNYASMMMTSSWMAALYFQALHEYYRVTSDQVALQQVSRYVDFMDAHGIVDGAAFHPTWAGTKVPYYLYGVGTFYDRETPSEDDASHCLDVSGIIKWGIEAKITLGQSTAAAQTRYTQMRACAVRAFANWTRSTTYLPKYRLNPVRLWNWWVRAGVF